MSHCDIMTADGMELRGWKSENLKIFLVFKDSSCSHIQTMLGDELDKGFERNFRARGSVIRVMLAIFEGPRPARPNIRTPGELSIALIDSAAKSSTI
jgi:hypothetical protein